MQKFKWFILNEQQAHLGVKLNDILTALQELQQDMAGMNLRHVVKITEDIVNQLRKILHSQWSPGQTKQLKQIQKIAVALMKTIEDDGDLKEIIPSAAAELEKVMSSVGQKANALKAPEI